MALTICRECKNDISSKANSCPRCGYKKSCSGWTIGFLIVVAILAIPAIVDGCGADSPRPSYSSSRRVPVKPRKPISQGRPMGPGLKLELSDCRETYGAWP